MKAGNCFGRRHLPPVLVDRDDAVVGPHTQPARAPERRQSTTSTANSSGALEEIESDRDVRALVLTGAGRGFCVGADLKSHSQGPMSAEERREYIGLAQTVNAGLQYSRLPVVAAVNGHAIGAGLELALSADFVLSWPEMRSSAFLRSLWARSSVVA